MAGEVRPTHKPKPKIDRWWRTREDPFGDVWPKIGPENGSAWLNGVRAGTACIAPVIGPQSVEELDACVKALSLQLTEQQRRWLNLEEPGR